MNIKRLAYIALSIYTLFFSFNAIAIPDPDEDGGSSAYIAVFNVSSSFAKVGKPIHVQWTSLFTVGCGLWTSQNGSRSVPTTGSTTVTPNSSGTMSVRLSCSGRSGRTVSKTRSFSVNAADHPELLSLNVSNTSAEAGSQITLSWSSSFSDFCQLSGTNSDVLPTSGTQNFFVISGSNKFEMVCKKYDGRTSNKLTRYVSGVFTPIINRFILLGSAPSDPVYWLDWQAVTADLCTLDGIPVSTTGARNFNKPSNIPVLHTLTCTRGQASETRQLQSPVLSTSGGGGDGGIGIIIEDDCDPACR